VRWPAPRPLIADPETSWNVLNPPETTANAVWTRLQPPWRLEPRLKGGITMIVCRALRVHACMVILLPRRVAFA
jgi:hypothetical protein